MSGRPEILFPLFAGADTLQGVGPKTAQNLSQIDIETPRDLLFSLPYSVVDRRRRDTVRGADLPATVTVEVTVGRHRPARNRGGAYRIHVEDAETEFPAGLLPRPQPLSGGAIARRRPPCGFRQAGAV